MGETIPAVKGTRDFYPEDFALLDAIISAWRRASIRHGFCEYEGPTLEHTELYTRKSGDEIVEQLFTLTDRGGRSLALRPEMTPTLARMVAARASSLPRPIKWFCVARMYRGERPQRGRLREFYQWNADVLGVESEVADAECILVAVDGLRALGLTAADVVVRISDRRVVSALLEEADIPAERLGEALGLLDRASRLPAEEAARQWEASLGRYVAFGGLWERLSAGSLESLGGGARVTEASGAARALLERLQDCGILEFCKTDFHIVRGLAYYTGPVFEIHDRGGQLRAVCGGGRYDDLLAGVGGDPLPAVGFGMGDVVLLELLRDLGRLPAAAAGGADVFVIRAQEGGGEGWASAASRAALGLVAALRRGGYVADFAYEAQSVAKQMKRAAARGAKAVLFVGAETSDRGVVTIKDMASGRQREAPLADLLANPAAVLGPKG